MYLNVFSVVCRGPRVWNEIDKTIKNVILCVCLQKELKAAVTTKDVKA